MQRLLPVSLIAILLTGSACSPQTIMDKSEANGDAKIKAEGSAAQVNAIESEQQAQKNAATRDVLAAEPVPVGGAYLTCRIDPALGADTTGCLVNGISYEDFQAAPKKIAITNPDTKTVRAEEAVTYLGKGAPWFFSYRSTSVLNEYIEMDLTIGSEVIRIRSANEASLLSLTLLSIREAGSLAALSEMRKFETVREFVVPSSITLLEGTSNPNDNARLYGDGVTCHYFVSVQGVYELRDCVPSAIQNRISTSSVSFEFIGSSSSIRSVSRLVLQATAPK